METNYIIIRRIEKADSLVKELIAENPPPGLAIGIIYQGNLAFKQGYGYANIEKALVASKDTVFRLGSISKTFTAIAIMQLWEQGLFKLDDPINQYLKAFEIHPPTADSPAITFHHLLSHTSGLGRGETIREFIDVLGHFTGWWKPRFTSLNEFYSPDGLHPIIPAGKKYSYSNNGYAILGQLVEDISGQPFAHYMHQHVFDPLGMAQSAVTMNSRVYSNLAMGYKGNANNYTPIRPTEICQQGAGSMLSSLHDMALFVKALLRHGQGILQPQTWELMCEPHWQSDSRLCGHGYGIQLQNFDGHYFYDYAGGAGGFNAYFAFDSNHQLGLIALSNRHLTSETVSITWHLMRYLLALPPVMSEGERASTGAIGTEYNWVELVGYYAPSPGWKTNIDYYTDVGIGGLHIYIEDNKLMMRSDYGRLARGKRLYPDSDDPLLFYVWFSRWNPYIFKRNEDGQIDSLMFDYFFILDRQPVTHSLKYRLKRIIGLSISLLVVLSLILKIRRKQFFKKAL